MEQYIPIHEEDEINKIQKAILQIQASSIRLGVGVGDIKVQLPLVDAQYFNRLLSGNPNWYASKFYKQVDEYSFLLHNVLVEGV